MNQFLDFFSTPWIGTAIGAIGVVLAIYFYVKTRVVSRLSYELSETNIVGTLDAAFSNSLELTYEGRKVPRVTRTTIRMWNSGNATIRHADVAEGDPLSAVLSENSEVLQTAVVRQTRPVNQILIKSTSDQKVVVGFDFLDPGDGFLIDIIHTDMLNVVGLTGTVIGLRGGFLRVEDDLLYWSDIARFMSAVFAPMALFTFIILWLLPGHSAERPLIRSSGDVIILLGGIALNVAVMSYTLKRLPQRFSWRRRPPSL